MKKLAPLMTREEFKNYYVSWFMGYKKYMSKKQIENIEELYNQLKEVTRP